MRPLNVPPEHATASHATASRGHVSNAPHAPSSLAAWQDDTLGISVAVPTPIGTRIEQHFEEIEHHQNRYARGLQHHVPFGAAWLDVGAGVQVHGGWKGDSQDDLVRRASCLLGCDPHTAHLRSNPHLTGALGALGESLPFADHSFDIVTANMVLEHVGAPHAMFAEVSRVLRPGGKFLFVTPNVRNPIVGLASVLLSTRVRSKLAVVVEKRTEEHVFPTFYRANSVPALRALAAAASLGLIELDVFNSFPFSPYHQRAWALEVVWITALRALAPSLQSNLFGVLVKT
jgi:SAM-dependent methyltransferase